MTSTASGPVEGPCTAWITGDEVAECCAISSPSTDQLDQFDVFAVEASMLLFELSGRKYAGSCEQTVRPCAAGCGCWGAGGAAVQGTAAWYWAPWQGVWSWWGEGYASRCGACSPVSKALLPGYPVTGIVEVKIGDTVLPEIAVDGPSVGQPNWRLDGWRELTRLGYIDDQGIRQSRWWPACQDLSLPDGQPGTWSVTYEYGTAPPLAGVEAAKQLACELQKSCSGGDCALPAGVTRVQRQGITIDRGLLLTWGAATNARGIKTGGWTTGLTLVDAFLSAYNPFGNRRRPGFWSPDLPEYAQKLGT